jgi:hypothetical protein
MKKILAWLDSLINRLATNYTLWVVGGIVALLAVAYTAYSTVFIRLPEPPVYAKYVELQPEEGDPGRKHGWNTDRRERYYQTSQGSLVMPYAWFRALEWRTSTQLFASPEVQTKYGLLPDNDPTYNKDQMPVGIVKNIVPDQYINSLGEGEKEWASLSCAACHTGQILYNGTALRIDGGQSFWNFDKWSGDMVFSLMLTSASPQRFHRFCGRVYGLRPGERCSPGEVDTLRAQLKRYFNSYLVKSAIDALINHTYPTTEGFTRTSAIGRGINGEFGPLDPCSGPLDRHCNRNVNRNTGPVSYPPLWYTHEYDWVQSMTAISQPLGRNVTEAWGVSVRVELNDPYSRFASTANVEDMFWMETLISILQAPKWPEDILGKIDWARVERGRYLYHDQVWNKALPAAQAELPPEPKSLIGGPNPTRPTTGLCARCHAPAFEAQPELTASLAQAPGTNPNQYSKRFLQLPLYRLDVMGTDEDDVVQFNARRVQPGVLKELFKQENFDDQGAVGIGDMLTVTINGILDKWFKEHNISEPCKTILQGYRPNQFRAPLGYPARPLDGYWTTGPFLHNGSVRTLYELLSPVSERARSFWIGSREFDPYYVGYRDELVEGAFKFDISHQGNSNAGHEFRDAPPNTPGVIGPSLSREQRLDLIEYLKVMDSVPKLLDADPATKDRLAERNALLDALTPFYEKNVGWFVYGKNKPESEGGYSRMEFCKKIEEAASRQSYPASSASPYPSASPGASPSSSPSSSPSPSPTATPARQRSR